MLLGPSLVRRKKNQAEGENEPWCSLNDIPQLPQVVLEMECSIRTVPRAGPSNDSYVVLRWSIIGCGLLGRGCDIRQCQKGVNSWWLSVGNTPGWWGSKPFIPEGDLKSTFSVLVPTTNSIYCILLCIMPTHVFGPNYFGKKSFNFSNFASIDLWNC